MYLAWAAFYEGLSDRAYFDILLPRVLDEILVNKSQKLFEIPTAPATYIGKHKREKALVALEICQQREAFHLLFIHADTGGRDLERGIASRREAFAKAANQLCEWPCDHSVFLSPRHETEAWVLADGNAVCRALGYRGPPSELGLPSTAAAAERIGNPKTKLDEVVRSVSQRAYRGGTSRLLSLIAQEQDIEMLRGCSSFQAFEISLLKCLSVLGCF